jgi:hypothetical protein
MNNATAIRGSNRRRVANAADRICQAYVRMTRKALYRPAAPGDGLGSVHLSADELKDPHVLDVEARKYAAQFIKEEDGLQFFIGCSNYRTNRALVYTIEAARFLCCGMADDLALRLLRMATEEVKYQTQGK